MIYVKKDAIMYRKEGIEEDSYSRINPCSTAGKGIGVWNCHATRGDRKLPSLLLSSMG
jgi:hypothetical protein